MKIRVFTEDKLTAIDLKKIKDIIKSSKSPNQAFNATFPKRYRGITCVSKKQTNVYFDSMYALGHTYEIET